MLTVLLQPPPLLVLLVVDESYCSSAELSVSLEDRSAVLSLAGSSVVWSGVPRRYVPDAVSLSALVRVVHWLGQVLRSGDGVMCTSSRVSLFDAQIVALLALFVLLEVEVSLVASVIDKETPAGESDS